MFRVSTSDRAFPFTTVLPPVTNITEGCRPPSCRMGPAEAPPSSASQRPLLRSKSNSTRRFLKWISFPNSEANSAAWAAQALNSATAVVCEARVRSFIVSEGHHNTLLLSSCPLSMRVELRSAVALREDPSAAGPAAKSPARSFGSRPALCNDRQFRQVISLRRVGRNVNVNGAN